jgi:hypothetical protein
MREGTFLYVRARRSRPVRLIARGGVEIGPPVFVVLNEGRFRSDRRLPLAGPSYPLEPCLKENEMPKFMFLQYVDESKAPRPGTSEMDKEVAEYSRLFQDVEAAGILRGGDPVQPSAATFSVQVGADDRTTTTDGPMQEGGPWLNGYWVLECRDRDDAVRWAAKIPAAHGGGTVEVHPIFSM